MVRALLCLKGERFEEALMDLNRALQIAPDHAVARYTRGIAHARRGEWRTAAGDFEAAFRSAPELLEARRAWRVAERATQHATLVTGRWHLGVFGTGIQTEAELTYAATHARDLIPGRPQALLYVAIQGNLPMAGADRMTRQGVTTAVVDPRSPQAGLARIEQFVQQNVAGGMNPIVFIDVNKWVPTQLGNNKRTAVELPAEIAAHANQAFRREVNRLGGLGTSTMAAHSDFTWVANRASVMATAQGLPFGRVILESPRSEAGVKDAVRSSPMTQFTVVQPVGGDFFTKEAQQRALGLQTGAYPHTIDAFKNLDARNYRFALIENPTGFGGLVPRAHGDPANYDRFSQVTFWNGGQQIGAASGALGQLLGPKYTQDFPGTYRSPAAPFPERGGISVGPVHATRLQDGRVIFRSDDTTESIVLVFMLFGGEGIATRLTTGD